MSVKSLEIKLLLHKYDSLKTELNMKNEMLDVINNEFLQSVNEGIDPKEENNQKNNKEKLSDSKEVDIYKNVSGNGESDNNKRKEKKESKTSNNKNDNKNINLPNDIKKIYRKISVLTHPDKLKDDDPFKEQKMDYYIRVQESAKKNDISDILVIGYNLGIDINLENDYTKILNSSIKNMGVQIRQIEYTNSWIWYHSENENLKQIVIERIRNSIRKSKRKQNNKK